MGLIKKALVLSFCILTAAQMTVAQTIGDGHHVNENDVGAAIAEVAAAKAAQEAALSHLISLTDGLKAVFESSPEYVKAQSDADAAQKAYDLARGKAIAGLQSSKEYQDAIAERDRAAQAVIDARAAGTTGQDMVDIAKDAMKARSSDPEN